MKDDFQFGSSSLSTFWYWINERHRIWCKRNEGKPKPWTKDVILRQYKFTNAFRELDRGTLVLRKFLLPILDPTAIVRNLCCYRYFNHPENATFGPVYNLGTYIGWLRARKAAGLQLFTGAYMTAGAAGEDKLSTYHRALEQSWDDAPRIVKLCELKSMEVIFDHMLDWFIVGKFVAYELVCDLRFTPLLENATDKLTWSSVGPGARRGLGRLGLPMRLESMVDLLQMSHEENCLEKHVRDAPVPFELREIEHSLCEFDKYERVRTGAGTPRSRYDGG